MPPPPALRPLGSARTTAARGLWLALPVLAGATLRLWHLPSQIVGGDELNGVHAALRLPLARVLTTYQLQDPCLPMAGFYRLLLDCGVRLSELWVRVPPLLFGLAALIVLPWYAARRLGRPAGVALAWLVALAPLLVIYSRIARPYMPIALLGFAATAAFEIWWRTRRLAAAAAYVVLGALCVYFHLGSAPMVVAPFLFALGALAVGPRESRPDLPAILAVGAAELAAFLAFMLPAWPSLHALIGDKHNPYELRWGTLTGVLELQAGTGSALAAVLFWGLAVGGLAVLLRRERRLAVYSLTLVLAQIAGLIVLSPEMLGHPLVFDRYLIPAFPWILLWAAAGLAALWTREGRFSQRIRAAAAVASVAVLFLAGPLVGWEFRAGSFAQHNDFLAYFCPPARLTAAAVPGFYRGFYGDIAAGTRRGPVLEFPWFTWWSYTRAYYIYQEAHRQEVLLSPERPVRGEKRLDFRNMVRPDPEAILASRARWLVVHADLPAEEDRVIPHCWQIVPELKPQHRHELQRAGQGMADWLIAVWGEPDLREGGLLAWDLDRVRQSAPVRPLPAP